MPRSFFGATASAVTLVAFVACLVSACSSTSNDSNAETDRGGTADGGTTDGDVGDAEQASPLHVLFIGDSYTYVNDLPGMLTSIAATSGTSPLITTDEVVQGGATLEVLWEAGAPEKIQQGSWTHVVLQGQSLEPLTSLPGNDQSTFQTYVKQLGDLIVAAGAQPTLFDTWARASSDTIYSYATGDFACPAQMQDELTIAYAKAATLEPTSVLVCAGEAFKEAIAQHPEIVLQQSDFSHPTVAGTYLAASTFYVALTGKPVPEQSAVPAGLSATDAATLRDIARVGSNCSKIQLKGAIATSFPENADGSRSYDFGTDGLPITTQFQLSNSGGATVGIHDALTLAAPFTWTSGGAYPGGSDPDSCADSLAPGSACTISVTYSGASSATGTLKLDFTGDTYLPSASCALHGVATDRALLTVNDSPGFFACTDDLCSPAYAGAGPGVTSSLDLFVLNRGAAPATMLSAGTALTPPFAWVGGAYPGGSGSLDTGPTTPSIPYCGSTLGVGEECVIAIAFSPGALGTYAGAVDLAYADAMGALSPNAKRSITGKCAEPLPP